MAPLATAVTVSARVQQPPNPRTERLTKALKHLEARRATRAKTLAASLAKTLQRADQEARHLFVRDLQDVAAAASEALLPAEPVSDDPPTK